ncbi:CRISPR system precrRNA processing endoribonuclease RAMP protein Cas6 [Tardisphaera miroshnichenkoae]
MLHRISFEFVVPSPLKFQSFSGFEVRGFFYSVLSSVNETMASSVHGGKALAPFAVTPVMLHREGGDVTCYDRVSPGLATFSFVLFRDDEARAVEEAMRKGMSSVKLVDWDLPLTTVRLEQIDPQSISREKLSSFALDFYTPTYFRATPVDLAREYSLKSSIPSPYRFVPLPDPILLFRSLLRTWREFVGISEQNLEEFMSWVEAGGVLLSGFPGGIFTKRVYEHPMTNKWAVGFVGRTNFSFSKKLYYDKMAETASLLLRFGEIVGVGAGRTSGMGRYRLQEGPENQEEQEGADEERAQPYTQASPRVHDPCREPVEKPAGLHEAH